MTKYFIDHLPEDYVPYWDLIFSDGSCEPRDTSAAAIAACGILEMEKYYHNQEFLDIAKKDDVKSFGKVYDGRLSTK